jgi:prepilin-type N-terminal cleavage/methylation domain-containing protein
MNAKRKPGRRSIVELRLHRRTLANMRIRHAFTLVELLVVLFIIACLVALMLPATRGAREAARRNTCISNFKQLAIAIQNHHDKTKVLGCVGVSRRKVANERVVRGKT